MRTNDLNVTLAYTIISLFWTSSALSKLWRSKECILIWHTREVVKRSGDVFGWVAIGCVADHQAGFAHRSVAEQDALQQPLLRLARPGGCGVVRGHRRGHGPSVIHGGWR